MVAIAACGGDDDNGDDEDGTPSVTRTAASSPTSGSTDTAVPTEPAPTDTQPPAPPTNTPPPPAAPTNTPPPPAAPTNTPPPPPPPQPTTLTLSAANIAFNTSSLAAPAGSAVTVQFSNTDNGIPHNLHFFAGPSAASGTVGSTAIQPGPVNQSLSLGALAAGAYYYQCDVHPNMNGTLTVS
jgi:plastocyanin